MVEIKIKNSVIEPLFVYEPKLNDWHEKSHNLDYAYCLGFSKNVLEPIIKRIKEVEIKERAEHRWHYCSDFTKLADNSSKFLKRVFAACKVIMRNKPDETIKLYFID